MENMHLHDVQLIWNIWPFTVIPIFWLIPRILLNIFFLPLWIVFWWMPILWNFFFEEF